SAAPTESARIISTAHIRPTPISSLSISAIGSNKETTFMMRIRSLMLLLIAFVAAPMFAARGSANFTTFVAIGDSYGAGVQSGSLNANHQPFSWPAVIARQAGVVDFQQPLVSFPGIGPELQLVDIIH